MGRAGPVMAFVHPNPMDQSCWIFQMAHMSTWFRCIAIDIPGYGRSPKATSGLTMDDIVSVQVFCSDLKYYETFNNVYKTYFHGDYPARAFVGAGSLLRNGKYEVMGIAIKKSQ